MLVVQRTYLIYHMLSHPERRLPVVHDLIFSWADSRLVENLFAADPPRRKTFLRHLRLGYRGVIWHSTSGWASYAWIALPGSPPPPHLTSRICAPNYSWIFYCRTRDLHAGRGLFKASISLLASYAREAYPDSPLYIDTTPGNTPSRRAILSSGFEPHGIALVTALRLPKRTLNISATWDTTAAHPPLPR